MGEFLRASRKLGSIVAVIVFLHAVPVLAADVTLTWDANTEPTLAGYKLYYGTSSRSYGSPINAGRATTYTLTGLADGTYYFAVTAYDTSGVESGYSNEVSRTLGMTCTYSISPVSQDVGAGSGTGSITVTAPTYCAWTAVSNAGWITVASLSGGGMGNGIVNYTFLSNTSSSPRSGTITVAGQTFTLNQAGAPTTSCSYSLDPTSLSFASDGGSGVFNMTAPSGCSWTASASASWISLSGDSTSGSGSKAGSFSVQSNKLTKSRSGTITAAGKTITVTQDGSICSISISPTGETFSSSGGTGTVSVSAGSSCSWLAGSNASWITITSGSSGTGNGNVRYSVQPNPYSLSRTGTLTIGGKSFTVTQNRSGCTFSIAPISETYTYSGGKGSVTVTTQSGCTWTASNKVSWIKITAGKSGTGNGTVTYSVDANNGNNSRTGAISVADQTFDVYQTGKFALSFSQFAYGEDWISSLVLINPSSTETVAGTVKLVDDQGQTIAASLNDMPASETISFEIQPLGRATFTPSGEGDLVSGAVQVQSDKHLSGVVKYSHPELGTTGVGESLPVRVLMMPVLRDRVGRLNTGVAIQNTLPILIEVTLSLRGMDGSEVPGGSVAQIIPANGKVSKFIDELFPQADTAGFEGTLIVSSDEVESIAAIAIQIGGETGEFTSLPVVPVDPEPQATQLYFAQFANGADWTSSVLLTNPMSTASTGELTFFDGEGNPAPISLSGSAATSDGVPSLIQPQGGAVIPTDGRGQLVTGSARVKASNGIGGMLRFSLPGLGMTGVGASEPMDGFITQMDRSIEGEWSTGIAIASVGSPVRLTLTLRDEKGAPVAGGRATIELKSNGHVARFLEQLFPQADTAEFHGTMTVESEGGQIVGTAIQIGARAGQLTNLPVTSLR